VLSARSLHENVNLHRWQKQAARLKSEDGELVRISGEHEQRVEAVDRRQVLSATVQVSRIAL
jgi:hypothetical protein